MYKVKNIKGYMNGKEIYEEYEGLLNSIASEGYEIISIRTLHYEGTHGMHMINFIITYKV